MSSSLVARQVRLYSSVNGFKSQAPALSYFQRAKLPANTIIKFVPQQTAYVVERMGKFSKVLKPGMAILIPILDKITYVQSLKETAIEIPSQNAITADNVSLELDGVLYVKVHDPYKASYGVEDFKFAISQLAQTTMRSEIGSMNLDSVLKERQKLNVNINKTINEAAREHWGVECLRYEIRDIHPPQNVLDAMHRQVSADRAKRAEILESEGTRQSRINIAEGEKQAAILNAESTALSIERIARSISETAGGRDAANLQVAQKYIKEFGRIAKTTNTVVIPSNMNDLNGMIASGLSIFDSMNKSNKKPIE
ncbi:hypothetical protein FT663_04820 [Candidozyma haemuli var. vulneris]|uniref:Band 7 domain-containing protein n=1 Tax=Candidozyma haemuli TaxID=45357 RepID=A0A2V1AXL9_9ASCO|nr:hypothetical protein CXQ85_004772 [[Candida] haemuloni]KAF3984987.1 hypothetical protein FT662_05429 [[Candida] haemuloni var. vulneris]KAF3986617.1 hypothetical protein FT663_04820 [[Candida] haemuloni var. vulneris]PVH22103.1 hypothetical protein CXQ85_004772 [[Candida] haemuloni]